MTTYKGIRGLTIQTVDGDPSNLAAGDIWYNSSSKKIKGAKIVAGSWATGGNMNTARVTLAGAGKGTQTAAWMCTGTPGDKTSGEEWNGASWSDANDCNSGQQQRAGSGPQTAAIMMGSEPATDNVEAYDGTTWTEVADTPTSIKGSESAGTSTAAILLCGKTPGGPQAAETWDFNGSAFTAAADTNTTRFEFGSLGLTAEACMCLGGTIDAGGTTRTDNVEEYDGTSWTESANLEAISAQGDGAGTSAAGIMMHGYTGPYGGGSTPVSTEEWTHGVGAVTFTSS